MSSTLTYEELCASHRWDVPPRYNIAADVCDKHPRDKAGEVMGFYRGDIETVLVRLGNGESGQYLPADLRSPN